MSASSASLRSSPSSLGAFKSSQNKSGYRTISANSAQSTPMNASRKRVRSSCGDDETLYQSPASRRGDNHHSSIHRSRRHGDTVSTSPATLANSTYFLANGTDTPTMEADARLENFGLTSENEFRRRWTTNTTYDDGEHRYRIFTLDGLDRERNGPRKRKREDIGNDQNPESWGHFAFRLAGTVAGALWDFCRGSGFEGFQAGGGTSSGSQASPTPMITHSTPRQSATRRTSDGRFSTPIPGQFPEDDVGPAEDTSPSRTERPTKKLQTRKGGEDGGWVVVDKYSNESPREQPAPRLSTPQRTSAPRLQRQRHSAGPKSTVSNRLRTSTARLPNLSAGSNARKSSDRYTASHAPSRSPSAAIKDQQQLPHNSSKRESDSSPMIEDVQKYKARREREERRNDASIRRLNQQLKSMIQEGQTALASKYEVDGDFGIGTDSDRMSISVDDDEFEFH